MPRRTIFGSFSNVIHIMFTIVTVPPDQVGAGLEYLHNCNILYRDLKSDNILVCSMDPADTVNVKISDYGISKFTTAQGMVGMVGTPGYMAPEIMDGQAYNEKVIDARVECLLQGIEDCTLDLEDQRLIPYSQADNENHS